MFSKNNNKQTLQIILLVFLVISLCLNFYFFFKVKTDTLPPENMSQNACKVHCANLCVETSGTSCVTKCMKDYCGK